MLTGVLNRVNFFISHFFLESVFCPAWPWGGYDRDMMGIYQGHLQPFILYIQPFILHHNKQAFQAMPHWRYITAMRWDRTESKTFTPDSGLGRCQHSPQYRRHT